MKNKKELTNRQCSKLAKKLRQYARFLDAPYWRQTSIRETSDDPLNPWEFSVGRWASAIKYHIEEIIEEVVEEVFKDD